MPDYKGRPAYGKEVGISILGVIVSKSPQKSVVLIKEIESNRVTALKIEKKILDKYPIKHIDKDYIVVEKNKEILLVYKDKFAGKAIAESSQKKKNNINSFSEDGFERSLTDDEQIEVKMTEAYRDNLIGNELQKILMQATALPYFEEEKIVGFQLTQIDKDSIFSKGGFENNDVITNVNGLELNSISGAVKLLKSLKGEKKITVNIKRGNQTKDLTISID